MMLSFVIPCYNSSNTIIAVVDEITQTIAQNYQYEIICVNDHSSDNVYTVLALLASSDKHVKVIDLAKNTGQHNAIMAGLNLAIGDIVIVLDDDGQSPINELDKLIRAIEDGADAVLCTTKRKKHSILKLIGSKTNELMAHYLIGTPANMNIVSLFAMRRFVVQEISRYTGAYSYILGLIYRTTKNISWVEVTHRKREIGKSNYSFKKLLSLWLNGFTAFSVKPLRIASVLGFLTAVGGFSYGVYIIVYRLLNPSVTIGYSSLMSVILFIGGTIMLMLGLIGEYVGRIYISINNAPQYVVRETINFDENFNKS